jgi:hypothetical protein
MNIRLTRSNAKKGKTTTNKQESQAVKNAIQATTYKLSIERNKAETELWKICRAEHAADLEGVKAKHIAEMEAVKAKHKAELEAVKAMYTAKCKALKGIHAKMREDFELLKAKETVLKRIMDLSNDDLLLIAEGIKQEECVKKRKCF